MKKIYKIRQGLVSNGETVMTMDEAIAKYGTTRQILDVGSAPMGHPARLHNERIQRSANKHSSDPVDFLKAQATCNFFKI